MHRSKSPALPSAHPFTRTCLPFEPAPGKLGRLYSLPALGKQLKTDVSRLPVCLRVVLEAVLRHCDGKRITAEHVRQLAGWQPQAARSAEIPFVVARIVLQDFTGVPLLADLAAMRHAAKALGRDPARIEPLVPVDLVVDHSVMVDHQGQKNALGLNMKLEFQRNHERYQFMKWGMQAFDNLAVVPPGFGIVHQVNLEHLARGVHRQRAAAKSEPALYYPDSLVGTDSHTTMINGIGVVGWGVGGIEAESGMLGQPVYFLTPDVVGVELTGRLREGVTATDLVLTITEHLRRHKVVGKFVEFYGEGTRCLAVPDRATIANMAPEYGATMGFFPVDERTIDYFRGTGRRKREISAFEAYFRAQGLFGVPLAGQIDYSSTLQLDLGQVTPSLAGPKRPQDRIELGQVSAQFSQLFSSPPADNGFNRPAELLHLRHAVTAAAAASVPAPAADAPAGAPRDQVEMDANHPTLQAALAKAAAPRQSVPTLTLGNGDVLIAAITSCTNTSNPAVMLAAGLLAKKAVKAGLRVAPHIKTSLAPGSRIVTEYLDRAGLLPYLEKLGFHLAAYGCTTCIGNAGDLRPEFNTTITDHELVCAAVLSGNRNFEARIHPNLKANFLASPPLVVAYALAGTVLTDLMTQPLGRGKGGREVYLGDVWPSSQEIHALMKHAMDAKAYRANYDKLADEPGKRWARISTARGQVYNGPESSYIALPPFFEGFELAEPAPPPAGHGIRGARVMALFGDSITTDHISPAGSIAPDSPAGRYLQQIGVKPVDFNSYGARRGNHEVMMRGSFANVRIKNQMLPPREDGSRVEGGLTLHQPGGEQMAIFDAAMRYRSDGVPTVVFAGEEYGTGSSRDWAAKGTQLLGVKAVIARSFERIHRSNLVGMGVLPLQFMPGHTWQTLGLRGDELVDIVIDGELAPQREVLLRVTHAKGRAQQWPLLLRIDTPIEVDYYRHGGILPYVLRQLLTG